MCGVLLSAAPVRAAYMIPGGTIRPKDFSMVKKDGVYHLFFIRNNTTKTADSTETDFGHAYSYDLFHWFMLPPVFAVDPDGWDNAHVWAPHIVEHDGLYWMYYTGVTVEPGQYEKTQRMGLAVSSDLVTWNRLDHPILAASDIDWAWSAPLSPKPGFRDPFVMPDPDNPGQWLMYYTSSFGGDTAATVVGVARTDGGPDIWMDAKPLLITWRNYTFNQLTESPHVFFHDGLWYLFITTTAGQPLSFYTSADPVGDPAAWTYRGRLRSMLGFDTSTWFASEHFRDGTRDLFLFVNGDRIEVREIAWSASWQFSLLQPPLFHVVNMDWVRDSVAAGEQATLRVVCANPFAGTPTFKVWTVDSTGAETPVPPDSVQLPVNPTLYADTAHVVWVPRRWPAVPDSDTVTVSRFIMRTADSTAASGILTVGPPGPPLVNAPADTLPVDPPMPPEPIEILPRSRPLRAIGGSPLGAGPALAVELDAPAAARLDVYDLSGRRVRNLARRTLPAGVTVVPWDGRDDAGARLPRGLYFARLVTPQRQESARLLLTR